MSEATPSGNPAITPAYLRSFGLFGALSEEALETFAKALPVLEFAPGDFIQREAEPARELFVLLEGEVEVIKTTERGWEIRLSRMTAGQWFGDGAVLDVQNRFASVRAVAPSKVLVLTARDLDALYRRDLKSYTLLVLNLARESARRLRALDELMFDVVAKLRDQHFG